MIEKLLEGAKSNDSNTGVCVVYVYCDYNDAVHQIPTNILGALLNRVIASLSSEIPEEITKRYSNRDKKEKITLELKEVCGFLSNIFQSFRRSYICIDAIDECIDDCRKTLRQCLGSLLEDQNLNRSVRLFLTGRPHVKEYIEENIPCPNLPTSSTLKANADDIRAYILHELDSDRYKRECMNDNLRNNIIERIGESSGGMCVNLPIVP